MTTESPHPFCVALWFAGDWGWDRAATLVAVECALEKEAPWFASAGALPLEETPDAAGLVWSGQLMVITASSLMSGSDANRWVSSAIAGVPKRIQPEASPFRGFQCASWPVLTGPERMVPTIRGIVHSTRFERARLRFDLPSGLTTDAEVARQGLRTAMDTWDSQGVERFPAWWAYHRAQALEKSLGSGVRPSSSLRL